VSHSPKSEAINLDTNPGAFSPSASSDMNPDTRGCRFCGEPLGNAVLDLGLSPLCQKIVSVEDLDTYERFYPLRMFVCESCFLVQVHEHVNGEDIFSHYAYFSSFSDSWLAHASDYVDMVVDRLSLDSSSSVVEVASNDGYLLQNFVKKGIPSLGVEPAANVADAARERGVTCISRFFGVKTATDLAATGVRPDLMIANNVIAHVPDLNDFVGGFKVMLAEAGVLTVEFPHLMNIIEENQFDTIYQEHYCYYSLLTMRQVLAHHGLTIFDVEEIPTHGGSLRIFARHTEDESKPVSDKVEAIETAERATGYTDIETYRRFADRVKEVKRSLLEFLINAKREGKRIAGYGAPGKGNTLLNYCGIREDFIDFTVDRNPMKQNTFLPGSRIPVYGPEMIDEQKPDYVLILPWNLKDEVMKQLSHIRNWGGRFIVPIPELKLY